MTAKTTSRQRSYVSGQAANTYVTSDSSHALAKYIRIKLHLDTFGTQAWLAGKSTHGFPIYRYPFSSGISKLAVFHDTRKYA